MASGLTISTVTQHVSFKSAFPNLDFIVSSSAASGTWGHFSLEALPYLMISVTKTAPCALVSQSQLPLPHFLFLSMIPAFSRPRLKLWCHQRGPGLFPNSAHGGYYILSCHTSSPLFPFLQPPTCSVLAKSIDFLIGISWPLPDPAYPRGSRQLVFPAHNLSMCSQHLTGWGRGGGGVRVFMGVPAGQWHRTPSSQEGGTLGSVLHSTVLKPTFLNKGIRIFILHWALQIR